MRLTKLYVLICLFYLSLGAQSDNEALAKRHYRVAQEALKDGNLDIAFNELTEAHDLASSNARIQYYLAVVLSKDKNAMSRDPLAALRWLEGAMKIGLPAKESSAADELLAPLQYAVRRNESETRKAEVESKAVTLDKLTGFYEAGVSDTKRSEDLNHKRDAAYGGYWETVTATPLSLKESERKDVSSKTGWVTSGSQRTACLWHGRHGDLIGCRK